MRVGFDLRRMHRTGIGRYARNIFAALTAQAPSHEWVAVVQDDADAEWVRARTGAARVRCLIAPAAQYGPREMLRIPTRDVDLWHSPHPYQLGIGARVPVVLTLHDTIQITHAIGWKNVLARAPLRALLARAVRRARGLLVVSEASRQAFHELFGVPLARMRVAHNAADPVFAGSPGAEEVAAARARWGLPEHAMLYVGMSQPHKNLDRLLQALALLARDAPAGADAPVLAIVGPSRPAERAALDARIAALGLGPRVRFLGALTDADVRLAYHAARLVVQPSLMEGFGLTVLEAMQCGTPCVVSDIAVLREVAGDAAELVDPYDPRDIARGLRAVLDAPARSADLRARGRAAAARFSWRAAAAATLAAYDAALAGGGH